MQFPFAVSDIDSVKASDKGGIAGELLVDAHKLPVDCSIQEQLQNPVVAGSTSMERSLDDNTTPAKRKRDQMFRDVDASVMATGKDVGPDEVHSSSGCRVSDMSKLCVTCSKRQRYLFHNTLFLRSFYFIL